MERRSSLRRPIHHEATIRLPGGAVWPCIIADYCSEGMLIKFSLSAASAIRASQNFTNTSEFNLEFETVDNTEFSIKAYFVHMMSNASGIKFEGRHEDALNALVQDAQLNAPVQKNRQQVERITQECISAIQGFTAPILQKLYAPLVAEIKDAAVDAKSDQLANAYMASADRVEQNQYNIQNTFLEAIRDPIRIQQQQKQADQNDNLSIIDKNEFEDWLISRVIISKAETNYREHLLPLKMRLDALGMADKAHHQSPLGPALLVNSFQISVSRLRLESAIEKLVFNLFEKQVMNHLEDLYIQLNEILVSHDVLPELDLKKQIRKTKSSETKEPEAKEPETSQQTESNTDQAPQQKNVSPAQRPSTSASGSGAQEPEQATESNQSPTPDMAETPQFSYGSRNNQTPSLEAENKSVSNLAPPFANTQDGSENSDQNTNAHLSARYQDVLGMVKTIQSEKIKNRDPSELPKELYTENELKSGLSSLQSAMANNAEQLEDRIGLLERVLGNLSEDNEEDKAIDEDQQVAIDVVDRFFSSLKKNPRLTDDIKQQLFKLEIPVLKVLLEDEGFFNDNNSSVRAVMNRIAQLGSKGSRLSPAAQTKIENLVHQIVQEFEQDTKVFDSALEEFDKLVDRQNALYVKNVERVAAAAEGAHRVEQAKIAVARALNKRLETSDIPEIVETLIEHGWKDLLNLIHIKEGENSPNWNKYLAVIDDLIHYSEDPSQPIKLSSLVPAIQDGLKAVSGTEQTSQIVRDQLKSFFEHAPSGMHPIIVPTKIESPETSADTQTDRSLSNKRKSIELKPWILRAKSVQAGTWIQFNREGEEESFMRLVWVARGYSKYVFVNHQGMKVVELGLFKFAQYLKDGTATPDPDYEMPIVNQGLDDMVKDVYEKLAYEASHDKESGLPNSTEFCRLVRAVMKFGKRTAECSILYVRFVSKRSVEEKQLPPVLMQHIAETLKARKASHCVAGRLSDNDFILFATGEHAQEVTNECRSSCIAACEQDDESRIFMALTGESTAHLGFNNPESMIEHALEPIQKHQAELAQIAASLEADLTGNPSAAEEAIVEKKQDIDAVPTLVPIDEAAEEQKLKSELDSKTFEIFCQKAMLLSNDSVHEEQYEMIASEKDSGISFEPSTEEQARFIDQWWIDQLIANQKGGNPAWDSIEYMRIKLSGYAFQDDIVKEQLLLLAETNQVQAGRIWFDLHMCSVIPNIHAAADMMKQLMTRGYRFCLDQFGTSQSPFPLIKLLPVDLIKIDQQFMEEFSKEEMEESKATSIVEVAHYLGKEVLATSVDSAICLQRMKQMGVDYVQGSTVSDFELISE